MVDRFRTKPKTQLLLIIAAAVLIRVPVALYLDDQLTGLPGIHDQVSYDALARSLLEGRGYSFGAKWYPFTPANTPTAHWSFLYPLYLAGVYAVFGPHPIAARLLQIVLGAGLMCWLIYLIGRRVGGETTGLVGAALAGGYGYFIYFNAALMTETFFIICVLWALYLGQALKEKPTGMSFVGLGLALGLASLLRQTMLLVAPFLLIWLAVELRHQARRWWYLALPVAVMGLLIAPWTIRNYRVYGQWLPLNSNAGYALYASNHPNLETDWQNEEVVVPVPTELAGQNEAQLNQALTQKGIEFILADPQRYVWLSLDKSREYFRFWPSSNSSPMSNLVRVSSFGAYLPFMALGLILSLARWRDFIGLYLFIGVHTGLHLLSWPAPRYRLPVDAVLMVFAALAIYELARRLAKVRGATLVKRRLATEPSPGGQR